MEKLTKTSGENNSAMEYECEKYIAPEFKNADFLTRVQGDSMEPEFFSGDIVAYKTGQMKGGKK